MMLSVSMEIGSYGGKSSSGGNEPMTYHLGLHIPDVMCEYIKVEKHSGYRKPLGTLRLKVNTVHAVIS